MIYHVFTPLRVGGPPTPQAFLANSNIYTKNQAKTLLFSVFLIFTMCSVENTVIYAVFGIPLKTPLFTLFSSIFPCANAAGQLKHIYKKSFKNIVFVQCFYMFSVKNAVIYTFFGLESVQNTGFCSVFNALASKNHSKYRYLQCFFISVRFSFAGNRPK